MRTILILFSIVLTVSIAKASDMDLESLRWAPIGNCYSTISKIDLRLSLYRWYKMENRKLSPTNAGFWTQKTTPDLNPMANGELLIQESKDDSSISPEKLKVTMYTMLDSKKVFSVFEINKDTKQDYNLDIFAIDWQANWGAFKCEKIDFVFPK